MYQRAEVVRLNILSEVGRELASRYGGAVVPTIVVFGAGGEVVYRSSGMPDRREVVGRITDPPTRTSTTRR